MVWRPPTAVLFLGVGLAIWAPGPAGDDAAAQSNEEELTADTDSVTKRRRQEFDPIGIELGQLTPGRPGRGGLGDSFLLFPTLDLDLSYDDNIFASDSEIESDLISIIRPALELRSDWPNHLVFAAANAEIGRYLDNASEDFEHYELRAGGRLDLTEFESFRLGFNFGQDTIDRSSRDNPSLGDAPTKVNLYGGRLDWSFQRDQFLWLLIAGFNREDHKDGTGTALFGPPVQVDNDDDDILIGDYSLKVGFQAWPGTSFFVRPSFTQFIYDNERDKFGFDRDTRVARAELGLTYDASAVSFVDVGIGVLAATFDEPRKSNLTTLTLSAALVWNPLDSLTVRASADRDVGVNDSVFFNAATGQIEPAAGVLSTDLELIVESEVRRELLLIGDFAYSFDDFRDTRLEDTSWQVGLTLKWLANAYSFLELAWRYETLDSVDPTREFDRNKVTLRVGLQY